MSEPPMTQILYPEIDPMLDLGDTTTEAGKAWSGILDVIESSPGFLRVYWGRRLEEPEKVQIHIGTYAIFLFLSYAISFFLLLSSFSSSLFLFSFCPSSSVVPTLL
jgi:hypothetical protein